MLVCPGGDASILLLVVRLLGVKGKAFLVDFAFQAKLNHDFIFSSCYRCSVDFS